LLVVSEFIDGCTVSTLVGRSGPLAPTQALDIIRQVAHRASTRRTSWG
jgi:hypothetical protein